MVGNIGFKATRAGGTASGTIVNADHGATALIDVRG